MSSGKSKRCNPHKYHRVQVAGDKVWACGLPNCPHYMPKHMENLVLGKATICWNCGNETIMDSESMAIDRPICFDCRNPELVSKVDELLATKFGS